MLIHVFRCEKTIIILQRKGEEAKSFFKDEFYERSGNGEKLIGKRRKRYSEISNKSSSYSINMYVDANGKSLCGTRRNF